MDSLILLFCSFISCVIIVNLLFQFFNDRYIKSYDSKLLYVLLPIIIIFIVVFANMLIDPILNLTVNLLWVGFAGCIFYYEENNRKYIQLLESEALLMILCVAETLGVCLIDVIMNTMQIIPQNVEIRKSIETLFSKIILLFLYYAVFSRIWKKTYLRTRIQYILYLIMFIYSVVSSVITAIIADKSNPSVLVIIIGCTIFANMYLLYFIKFSDERNFYKLQAEMMEQQAKLQYESYEIQSDKYKEAMSILHDVDKHMKMIKELYQEDLKAETYDYIDQVREMLQPLVPIKYTENSVLNCLIFDKKRMAEKNGILFKVDVEDADINFMRPIDITTLFGNLIDNAIAASKECDKEKYIGLFMKGHNEMVSIRIENTVAKPVPIKNGKIENARSKRTGIGLQNIQKCVQAYVGSVIYKYQEHMLLCDIVLNRTDD